MENNQRDIWNLNLNDSTMFWNFMWSSTTNIRSSRDMIKAVRILFFWLSSKQKSNNNWWTYHRSVSVKNSLVTGPTPIRSDRVVRAAATPDTIRMAR